LRRDRAKSSTFLIFTRSLVKKLAIEDEDLKPLWDNMSGTMWKRE